MCRALFCDWDPKSTQYDATSLFEITDLGGYDIIFFDPLEFAVSNGLRENTGELWKAEYIDYSDKSFLQYIGKAKLAAEQLRDFLFSGGLWVMRSNLPKSYIKVRKKSVAGAGTGHYTESLTSAFFWLEEFLGKFTFDYAIEHTVRYVQPTAAPARTLEGVPVESVASLQLENKEAQYVIAESAHHPHRPIISRVSGGSDNGDIYVIPKLLVRHEAEKLVETFGELLRERRFGPYRPGWLDSYERKLSEINPHRLRIRQIDEDIARLDKEKAAEAARRDETNRFVDLLYTENRDLHEIVAAAFRHMGFQFPDLPRSLEKAEFTLYMRGDETPSIAIEVIASGDQLITPEILDVIAKKLKTCHKGEMPKVVVVANAPCRLSPPKRPQTFSDECIQQNLTNRYSLISTTILFELVCRLLENADSPGIENMKELMRQDIENSGGLFQSNTRKYLAASTV